MTRPARFFSLFSVAALVLAASACNKSEPPPPAGMPALPTATSALEGVAPEPSANPHGAMDNMLPPGHPPVAGNGGPAGEMPGAKAEDGYDPKAKLTGRITLSEKVKSAVAPSDVLFLVARIDDGSERGGMILGVKRFVVGGFPLGFEIDGRDAMAPGTKFEGKVLLSARVDKDGDAMTKNPGDVLGIAHVTIPAADVKLVLDTVTK